MKHTDRHSYLNPKTQAQTPSKRSEPEFPKLKLNPDGTPVKNSELTPIFSPKDVPTKDKA